MADMSRRGLLGLIAAAPLAAAAKSVAAHRGPVAIGGEYLVYPTKAFYPGEIVEFTPLDAITGSGGAGGGLPLQTLKINVDASQFEAGLNEALAAVKRANPQILWDDPVRGIAPTPGQTYEMPDGSHAVAGEPHRNHPPGQESPSSLADDEGPGAPRTRGAPAPGVVSGSTPCQFVSEADARESFLQSFLRLARAL